MKFLKFMILQNPTDNLMVRVIQLLLSLRNTSLDLNNGLDSINP